MNVKKRVREIRKKKGMSLKYLAECTGFSHSYLSRLETGSRNISIQNLQRIAQCLECSVTEILKPTDDEFVAGRVDSYGEIFLPQDEITSNDLQSRDETVVLRIDDHSMFPVFEQGNLIYYEEHQDPELLVNRRVIVCLKDQRRFVRILRRGSHDGVWTLSGVNGYHPDMIDVEIDWVAPITWIRYCYH